MNKMARVGVSVIACLAIAGFLSVAPSLARKSAALSAQSAAETHTVSGKITAIGKNSFTLLVGSTKKMSEESSNESNNGKSMTFLVDSNTTIDGSVQVGVDADVTYRIDSGQYVAVNVRVAQ